MHDAMHCMLAPSSLQRSCIPKTEKQRHSCVLCASAGSASTTIAVHAPDDECNWPHCQRASNCHISRTCWFHYAKLGFFAPCSDGWQSGEQVQQRYAGTTTWAPIMVRGAVCCCAAAAAAAAADGNDVIVAGRPFGC
jgi:hypothetical protein